MLLELKMNLYLNFLDNSCCRNNSSLDILLPQALCALLYLQEHDLEQNLVCLRFGWKFLLHCLQLIILDDLWYNPEHSIEQNLNCFPLGWKTFPQLSNLHFISFSAVGLCSFEYLFAHECEQKLCPFDFLFLLIFRISFSNP